MSPGSANTTRSGASIPPARTKAYPMSRSMRRPSATSNACVRCARMPRSSSTRRGTQVYSLPVSTKVSGKALREPRMSRFWTSIVVRKTPTSSMINPLSLLLSRALTQGDDKLVQLIERLDHCIGCSGAGSVERFLRRIALVQDHQRLAALFLEGHRGDRPALATFLIGPREARIRLHFDIRAEKRGRLGATVVEYQSVLASDTSIHLAGQQGHSHRLGHPPTLEQLGLGKCLEHDARRAVDGPRDNHLAVRLPFHRGAVLHGAGLTFDSCVHRSSPFVSVPRQPCPTRRSVRPSAGGTSRATPSLPPIGAGPAGTSARARSSSW